MSDSNFVSPDDASFAVENGLTTNSEILAYLRVRAHEISARAYAPYSQFNVGAAALVDDGRVLVGCNVENVSLGLALCAECNIVSQLYATGGGSLIALSCTDANGDILMPCGRCRQLLFEHSHNGELLIDHPGGQIMLAQLLPYAFGLTERDRIV